MTAAGRKPAIDPARRGAIAKVQIARKELRLQEPEYRAMMLRITGHESSAACTVQQLGLVLDEMKAKGWKPAATNKQRNKQGAPQRQAAQSPMARKARAMWISLHELGVVRDPSERSLESFGRRQLGVDRLQWADQAMAFRLIEALKAMAERAGWSQDLAGVPPALQLTVLKERLQQAIALRLAAPPAPEA